MRTAAFGSDRAEPGPLGAALEHEHREIDAGISAFKAAVAGDASEDRLTGAAAPLRRAIAALRRHIYLEEELLFPQMQEGLAIPIGVMLREHGEIWHSLQALEARLATAEGTAILGICDELSEQLDRHNSKEEPIFYTQADRSLSAAESAQLQGFLDSGRMPQGWACRAARA